MSELVVARADIASGAMTFAEYELSVKPCFDDPDTQTKIRGVDANAYFLGGLYEEFAETLYFDATPPKYSRIGMIALHNDDPLLATYRGDAHQLELHRREFGDLLWYMTALLHRMNASLADVAGVGQPGRERYIGAFDQYAATVFANDSPLEEYQERFSVFARSVADVVLRGNPDSRNTVAWSSHVLLSSMSCIAQSRLGTSLGGIARGNMEKLAARHRNGTIFGSGDSR